ncbi:hypothetical protein PMIN01_10280 [Paraphaeosphaeria minitans]|uniref:Uncharacterized protein n=1 Tax=Paraphaeosphaeria minitans TaxID=565426 RepID=A0A9P6G9Z3_9PLEO|nr:hypothetical protein PMIN01_10280 [Paraphaeosphaeria minitans]
MAPAPSKPRSRARWCGQVRSACTRWTCPLAMDLVRRGEPLRGPHASQRAVGKASFSRRLDAGTGRFDAASRSTRTVTQPGVSGLPWPAAMRVPCAARTGPVQHRRARFCSRDGLFAPVAMSCHVGSEPVAGALGRGGGRRTMQDGGDSAMVHRNMAADAVELFQRSGPWALHRVRFVRPAPLAPGAWNRT